MNAEPLLAKITKALNACKLQAVLIGNAAAALQGAPVTTLDFDFCFRPTRANLGKIQSFAAKLGGMVTRPNEPLSELLRVELAEGGLQVDFLPDASIGLRLPGLRARASRVRFGRQTLMVADLRDVARTKRAAARPKDIAALYAIEKTIEEKRRQAEHRT